MSKLKWIGAILILFPIPSLTYGSYFMSWEVSALIMLIKSIIGLIIFSIPNKKTQTEEEGKPRPSLLVDN